jgi:hypothetical protein
MGANLLLPQVSPTATSEAAARPAIELLRGPLKRPERAISKVPSAIFISLFLSSPAIQVYRCYKGIFSHLSDSVRCVIVCDSIKHIEEFMATLAKESFTRADKPPTILKRILRLAEVLLRVWLIATCCNAVSGFVARPRRRAEELRKFLDGGVR